MNLLNLNSFLKFGYFMDYKYTDFQVNFTNFDKKRSTHDGPSKKCVGFQKKSEMLIPIFTKIVFVQTCSMIFLDFCFLS